MKSKCHNQCCGILICKFGGSIFNTPSEPVQGMKADTQLKESFFCKCFSRSGFQILLKSIRFVFIGKRNVGDEFHG